MKIDSPQIIGTEGAGLGIGITTPAADLHISGSTADTAILRIQGGSSEILFASGSGKVGIGTTTPSSILDASLSSGATSGFRFKGYSDASTGYLLSLGTQTYPDVFQVKSVNGLVTMGVVGAVGASPDLVLQTNSTERLRILSGGNVGIGTTSPASPLSVQSAVEQLADFYSTDTEAYLRIRDNNDSLYVSSDAGIGSFGGNVGSNANNLNIDLVSGNVGIGITSPSYRLDVQSPGDTVIQARTTTNSAGNDAYFRASLAGASAGDAFVQFDIDSVGGYSLGIDNSDSDNFKLNYGGPATPSSGTNLLTVTSSGNVGIGTTNPLTKLDVSGSIYLSDQGPQITANCLNASSGFRINVLGLDGDSDDLFRVQDSGTTRFNIKRDGNVGIGTASPGVPLNVQGLIRAQRSDAPLPADPRALQIGCEGGLGSIDTFSNGGTPLAIAFRQSSNGSTYTDRMRIDPSGNVGIGTTSPDEKLEVDGKSSYPYIKISSSSNTSRYMRIGMINATDHVVEANGVSTNLILKTVGTEQMRIDSSGRVGIGVTPSSWGAFTYPIDVGPGSAFWNPGSVTQTQILTNSYNDGTNFRYKGTGGASRYRQNGNQHEFDIAASGTAGNIISFTPAMTIDSTGKVGIGISPNEAGLHLERPGADNVIAAIGQTGYEGVLYLSGAGSGKDTSIVIGNSRELNFRSTATATPTPSGTTRMRIGADGRLTSYLGSATGYQTIFSNNGGANNSYLALYQTSTAFVLTANKNGTGTRKAISLSTTGNDTSPADFVIDTSGLVGIGVTQPVNKLHLNGGKFILTSDEGSYGQLQVNAPSGGEATIVFGSTGSNQNAGGYTNAGVIGIGAYGYARDTLVLGTGYSNPTLFLKNGQVGIGVSPSYPLHVSGQASIYGTGLEHRFSTGGGSWKSLGSFNVSSNSYLHIKTSLTVNDSRMTMFRATGYYPYSAYGHGYIGCYLYTGTPSAPYGSIIANLGNHAVANNQYYSSSGSYWVIVLYWPSAYNSPWLEYIAAGNSYGDVSGVSVLAYTWTSSNTGAY